MPSAIGPTRNAMSDACACMFSLYALYRLFTEGNGRGMPPAARAKSKGKSKGEGDGEGAGASASDGGPPIVRLDEDEPGSHAAINPWDRIRAFLDVHGYDRDRTTKHGQQGGYTCKFRASFGLSTATFEARVSTVGVLTPHVRSVRLSTLATHPAAIDPPHSFGTAVSMSFERDQQTNVCDGHVGLISSKPTHGVLKGTDALGMAIAIGRRFGCRSLDLSDSSSLPCPGGPVSGSPSGSSSPVSLRSARILSRGAGWYESKGFMSLIEALEPDTFARSVGRLHTIPLVDLVAALRAIDAAARQALCKSRTADGSGGGSASIARYGMHDALPEVSSPAMTADVVSVLSSASSALDVLLTLPKAMIAGRTLGDAVDHLLRHDCPSARLLIDALLPHGGHKGRFPVMLTAADGSPVPRLPMVDGFVYAWRIVSTYTDLRLDLERGSKKGAQATPKNIENGRNKRAAGS